MPTKRKLTIIIAGSTLALALANPALANSFMLQFGSFQSADEAQAHLTELQNKHPGVMSRLPSTVKGVTLPPDNLIVYRTQAGPLATRGDAQSVCSQLASNGDECYVVESAEPSAAPSIAVASADMKATLAPAATSASTIPTSTTTLSPQQVSDAQANAAEDSVRKALDDASKTQDQALSSPPAQAPAKPKGSFWNNWFGSKSAPKPVDTADANAAPVDAVQAGAVDAAVAVPSAMAMTPTPPAPSFSAQADLAAPPAPVMDVAPPKPITPPNAMPSLEALGAPSAPILLASAPSPAPLGDIPPASAPAPQIANAAPNFPLPPPPAPLPAFPSGPATSVMDGTVAAAAPITSAPLASPTGRGNVHVEEARRVPSAPAGGLPALPPAPVGVAANNPNFAQIPSVSLSPSSTVGQHTLWAQIGPFGSPQEALGYWSNFRQAHPDFPVVRVRVTTPLSSKERGIEESNLRVGPFARPEFIGSLCTSLPQDEHMRCGSIADLGITTSAASPAPGYLGKSRYQR